MDGKQLMKMLSGGVGAVASYLLGVLQGVPPTEPISAALGGAGWLYAAIVFCAGAFGLNIASRHRGGNRL